MRSTSMGNTGDSSLSKPSSLCEITRSSRRVNLMTLCFRNNPQYCIKDSVRVKERTSWMYGVIRSRHSRHTQLISIFADRDERAVRTCSRRLNPRKYGSGGSVIPDGSLNGSGASIANEFGEKLAKSSIQAIISGGIEWIVMLIGQCGGC